MEEWLCSHGCRTAVIANPIKSIQFIDMGQFQCFASNYLHVKVLMLQMKMTTFPLGWLDLHHSESVLGLQPGEVGFAFSPLRTFRWKCYYNEEARTIIYQFCQKNRNLILSASRLASSFSLSSFTFLARSAYACKEINEHVLYQACKVL